MKANDIWNGKLNFYLQFDRQINGYNAINAIKFWITRMNVCITGEESALHFFFSLSVFVSFDFFGSLVSFDSCFCSSTSEGFKLMIRMVSDSTNATTACRAEHEEMVRALRLNSSLKDSAELDRMKWEWPRLVRNLLSSLSCTLPSMIFGVKSTISVRLMRLSEHIPARPRLTFPVPWGCWEWHWSDFLYWLRRALPSGHKRSSHRWLHR